MEVVNIALSASEKIIRAKDFVAEIQQSIDKVRP